MATFKNTQNIEITLMDTNGNLKVLLLKDLCGRLPYGVRLKIGEYSDYTLYGIVPKREHQVIVRLIENEREYDIDVYVEHIKPYLRPMSSMTEEEKEKYDDMFYKDEDGASICDNADWFDFMNSRHFDYRGLIEKNLALEAPEGMYNIK